MEDLQYDAELSDKQELFCFWYVRLGNATKAAEKAGYSLKTARTIGSHNLTKIDILARIKVLRKARNKRTYADAEKIKARLSEIAFQDAGDIYDEDGELKPISSMKRSARVTIKGIKKKSSVQGDSIEVVQHDAVRALVELAKMEGMYDLDNAQKKQTVILNFGGEEDGMDDIF